MSRGLGDVYKRQITDHFIATEQHHRMTQEFLDFAKIIDEKDYEAAYELLTESVTVVSILEKARSKSTNQNSSYILHKVHEVNPHYIVTENDALP